MKTEDKGRLLRIHIGEKDRYQGRPLHEEILARCRGVDVATACVYRGVEGYGASSMVHRAGLFGRSSDAPIVVTIIATIEQAARLGPALAEIVDEGLIAIADVEVMRYSEAPAPQGGPGC
ncbi:MAG: DUF190 domain-containing protein [Terriglobales bacterium]